MLEVQNFLRTRNESVALEELKDKLGIRLSFHHSEPLVILNYDQVESPKTHQITRECRALTLEQTSWNIVGRSFMRFFNAGECKELENKFSWDSFVAETKEDGSLMTFFWYRDRWLLTTRGSFATGEISPGAGKTWEEVFYEAIGDEVAIDDLDKSYTYVFELCSPYNKIVRSYPRPTLFLLTAFHNALGTEMNGFILDRTADLLRVERPKRSFRDNYDVIVKWLDEVDDPTFEGFVLRDKNGLRLKVKNKRYVALHHLKDNGNVFHPKRLLPLVLKGEHAEVLVHFGEAADKVFDCVEKVGGSRARMLAVWDSAKGIKEQRDFAKFVLKHTPLASILFEARKTKQEPGDIFVKSEGLLLKQIFEGK